MTNLGVMAKIRGDFREALRCYEEGRSRRSSALAARQHPRHAQQPRASPTRRCERFDAADEAFTEALTSRMRSAAVDRASSSRSTRALQIEEAATSRSEAPMRPRDALAAHLRRLAPNAEAEQSSTASIARETGDLRAAGAASRSARDEMARQRGNDLALEGDGTASSPSCIAGRGATARRCRRSTARTAASRSFARDASSPTSAAASARPRGRLPRRRAAVGRVDRVEGRAHAGSLRARGRSRRRARGARRASTRRRSSGSASARCCTTSAS